MTEAFNNVIYRSKCHIVPNKIHNFCQRKKIVREGGKKERTKKEGRGGGREGRKEGGKTGSERKEGGKEGRKQERKERS
jgi:hypothetical protein